MQTRKPYPSDLSDIEWQLISGFFPERKPATTGRPREIAYREIVNGILYLVRTGCQWRHLPHDLPVYSTVSSYYHTWRKNGRLDRIEEHLRRRVRLTVGKQAEPSVVIIDSQSVKTTEKGGQANLKKTIGYDAGKQIKGRKRHIAVDTLGLIWAQTVTAASVQDREGAVRLLPLLEYHGHRLQTLYADAAYAGRFEDIASYFYGWTVQIVKKLDDQKGFVVLPKRWMVERTLAWLSKNRRLSKDYEFQPKSSEAIIRWASIRRMTRWLEKRIT